MIAFHRPRQPAQGDHGQQKDFSKAHDNSSVGLQPVGRRGRCILTPSLPSTPSSPRYPGLPHHTDTVQRLRAALQAAGFAPESIEIRALLDWELSTLGDPLVDFAYSTLTWRMPGAGFRGLAGVDIEALGIPSEAEYIAEYCRLAGVGVGGDGRPACIPMDGYAVRDCDLSTGAATLRSIGISYAGSHDAGEIGPGGGIPDLDAVLATDQLARRRADELARSRHRNS